MTDITISMDHRTEGVKSPYLHGTNIQYAWDSTSLGLLKTCPRLYQYTMLDGWGSRDESIHLRFGIEYHSALQDYAISRAQGTPHEDAIHYTVIALHRRVYDWVVDRNTRAGKYKNRETIVGLVIDYLDHFSDDPADTFILDDGRPAVELSFRFALDWGPQAGREQKHDWINEKNELVEVIEPGQPYLLSGHLDRVVNFSDHLYVMDRKTSLSTLGTYYFNQWSPSNQMTLYTLAGKIMLNSPIKGVIIDAAQVLLEKPNSFQRGFTYRTDDQLDEWLVDLRYWLHSAETYATAGYWPQNDTSCDKFGGCKFREVCSKSPQVREQYLRASFDKLEPDERWNPLKAR
jgi:PD-(D/E)XK nuclease superfamily protein